ncbi:TPA: 2-amino-4-hydroxy-6-hydroxymethyldihydropteridine diphosphokinase [Candidatus Latescibacteria bacterium]|nr:2-amino-4-hydroxy-6-hydroxymethyldihydropteridine diphosphokinase [Candidatus Latescibacterota bacterium]
MTDADPTRAYVQLGANVGDPATTLQEAVARLDREPGIRVREASPVYRNPPMGPQDQPDYLNAVVALDVDLRPRALLDRCLDIEREFGRVRDIRWGPRTLDLDIVLFGSEIVDEPGLTIPHPRMLERSFVLLPLADLHPEGVHPLTQSTFLHLANTVGREDLVRVDVSLLPA